MTRFTRKLAVLGTAVGAFALVVCAPGGSIARAHFPVVVVDITAAPARDSEPRTLLPVDPDAIRVELARVLGAFVVAPGVADGSDPDNAPVALVHVTLGPDSASIVVRRLSPPNASQETQELTFQGALTHSRLVRLLMALVGPVATPTEARGMDVRVNPYHDPGVSVARLDPIPPRSPNAFFGANPYRVAGAAPAPRVAQMPIGQNPYR